MTRFITFLRGINVGGHRVKMDKLCTLFESMEFSAVETFISSGNVIFESNSKNPLLLQQKIESQLFNLLGYEVATFLRTDFEVQEIAQHKPFKASKVSLDAVLNVGFLPKSLGNKSEKKLMNFKSEIDDFHTKGREIYWLCQKKQSESAFSSSALEKALGTKVTFRGMKTILRLASKYPPNNKTT